MIHILRLNGCASVSSTDLICRPVITDSRFDSDSEMVDIVFHILSPLVPLIITIITIKTNIGITGTDHDHAPVPGQAITRRRNEGLERRVRKRRKPWYRSVGRNIE